jgi:pilus assembly protein Flp/PilA
MVKKNQKQIPASLQPWIDARRRFQAQTAIGQEHIMTNLVKRFANDESGATAIEYGLIAAGISVAIITVVNTLGSQLKTTFTNISSQLATAGK